MKTASITFRATPELKKFLQKQENMSQWINDACKTKMDKQLDVLQKSPTEHQKNEENVRQPAAKQKDVRQKPGVYEVSDKTVVKIVKNAKKSGIVRQTPEPLTQATKPDLKHSGVQTVIKTVEDIKNFDFEAARKATDEKRKS
mgnify:CR=1 FL=1